MLDWFSHGDTNGLFFFHLIPNFTNKIENQRTHDESTEATGDESTEATGERATEHGGINANCCNCVQNSSREIKVLARLKRGSVMKNIFCFLKVTRYLEKI